MIRFFMGEDTFIHGLQQYLNARKYKTAFHDDLWSSLQAVSKSCFWNIATEVINSYCYKMKKACV